jgi:hypothetical protein
MAAINSDVLKGKWQQLKGEARIQWGRLTDDDLDQIQGNIRSWPASSRSGTATSGQRPIKK